ncbi:MAG: hypothetical protein SNJ75_06365 [Gemmataceae bacterium]
MCRYRPQLRPHDGTLYTARLDDHSAVYLWGFGGYLVSESLGGLYLGRTGFALRLSDRPDALGLHSSDELLAISRPVSPRDQARAASLFRAFARWVAHYEHWVAENWGVDYRRHCLETWQKKPACSAHEQASAWEELARKSRRLIGQSSAGVIWHPWERLLNQLRHRVRHLAWDSSL